MRGKLSYIFPIVLGLMAVFTSCRQEICYDHIPAIDLSFAWEQEWERDYGMNHKASWDPAQHRYQYDELRPSVPEWVKMIKYYDDGHIVEGFFNPEGKKFEVPTDDKCSMLFYNGDTEYIILSDVASLTEARATATTRTRSGSSLQAMRDVYQVSRTTNPPDVIFSAFVQNAQSVQAHEVKPMTVKMQPLVYTYIVNYEFEHGFDYVVLARGALGGMAEGVYLRTGVTTDEPTIILFDCDIDSDACRSQVHSFGIPGFPDSYYGRADGSYTGPFFLNLEVKMTNGQTKEFNFDITDQMQKQPRGGVIKVSGLRIEDNEVTPPPAGGGFDIDLTDWGDSEEIDLP
ncbi:MAG: DUF5119 domain-containing protein, partial [Muribaculaceae bacterium]|nr:DUF5119 domain-containing protein [Muribaculaceae bacterium]